METQSPYLLMKQLELQLSSILSAIDIYSVPPEERQVISSLRRNAIDARLDLQDYELSETREGQLAKAKAARKRLETVRRLILKASEHLVFSAADVAQLTAQVEHIIARVE